MVIQDFDLFYQDARAKFSRSNALGYAVEAFILDIYHALGITSSCSNDTPVYISQLYDKYRALNYSHEKAWALCERTIINNAQQDFIDAKQRRGYTKHEAYDMYKAEIRRQRGKRPVFEQYEGVRMAGSGGKRSEYRSAYTQERQAGYTTTYKVEERLPPHLRAQGETSTYSHTSPPRSYYNARYEYRRSSPRSPSGVRKPRNGWYTSYSTLSRSPPRPRRHSHSPCSSRPPPSSHSTYSRQPPPHPSSSGIKPSTCLYKTLNIPRTAADADIQKAHRKMMMKWHPDRNRGNEVEATKRTKEINQARDVLMDERRRREYDRTGRLD